LKKKEKNALGKRGHLPGKKGKKAIRCKRRDGPGSKERKSTSKEKGEKKKSSACAEEDDAALSEGGGSRVFYPLERGGLRK